MAVYVIVPAYNEESVIRETVRGLVDAGYEVIVVDDGSTDQTVNVLKGLPIHFLRHAVNLGQGAALQTGMRYAQQLNATAVVHFDADGQHRVEDIARLLAPIQADEADVVLGSRFLSDTSTVPWRRKWLLKGAILINALFTGLWLSDAHNGLRALNATALGKITFQENGMAHATEILSEIRQHRLRYQEVPVQIHYSAYSQQKGQSAWHAFSILSDLFVRSFFSK